MEPEYLVADWWFLALDPGVARTLNDYQANLELVGIAEFSGAVRSQPRPNAPPRVDHGPPSESEGISSTDRQLRLSRAAARRHRRAHDVHRPGIRLRLSASRQSPFVAVGLLRAAPTPLGRSLWRQCARHRRRTHRGRACRRHRITQCLTRRAPKNPMTHSQPTDQHIFIPTLTSDTFELLHARSLLQTPTPLVNALADDTNVEDW